MKRSRHVTAELSVSDYSELGRLADFLRLSLPGAPVTRRSGRPGPGQQGALDVLMIIADSSVIAAALKVLPELLRSRKSNISITLKVTGKREKKELTVTADNVEEMLSLLDRFLDG